MLKVTRSLDEAIKQGYVILKGDHKVSSQYFKWCEEHRRPYLTIRPIRKYADVYLDRITVNRFEIEDPELKLKDVQHKAMEYLHSTGWLKQNATYSSGGGKVLEEHAVEVANKLIEIYSTIYGNES